MLLDTLGAHRPQALGFEAEVGDRRVAVLDTGDVVLEVGLHVLDREGSGHLNRFSLFY